MNAVVFDSGILGLLVHPARDGEPEACRLWLSALQRSHQQILIPVIADYELRRELIRIRSRSSIRRLDDLKRKCAVLPITTRGMIRAAELWAQMRQQGTPTAPPKDLDGDIILAAHVQRYASRHDVSIVVATTNIRHLSLMVTAREWQDIAP